MVTDDPPHPALRAAFSHEGEKECRLQGSQSGPLPSVGEGSGARAARPVAKLGEGGLRP